MAVIFNEIFFLHIWKNQFFAKWQLLTDITAVCLQCARWTWATCQEELRWVAMTFSLVRPPVQRGLDLSPIGNRYIGCCCLQYHSGQNVHFLTHTKNIFSQVLRHFLHENLKLCKNLAPKSAKFFFQKINFFWSQNV